jgi:hypothetical protein
MAKKVGQITNTWKKALQFIKAKDTENAIEQLDTCLLILARATESGHELLDNLRVDLWKMRVWVKIEDLIGLPEYDNAYERQEI